MSHTHGRTHTREYRTWANMINRCSNKNRSDYKYYGGNGISVCEEWKLFENFFNDMGEAPSNEYTLDRIDGTSGYTKSNCRWATMKEQNNNRSSTRFVFLNDVKMTKSQAIDQLSITRKTFYKYTKAGYTAQQINSIFDSSEKGKTHRSICLSAPNKET